MSSAAVLAAQGIADSLGVSIPKTQLMAQIAQEGELYIQQLIGSAALLYANAHAAKLTVDHVNRALIAENKLPLLGYNNSPSFVIVPVSLEQSELLFPREHEVDLTEASEPPPAPTTQTFSCRYLLTEGVPVSRQSLSTRRLIVKFPPSEKATPTPAFDFNRRPPMNLAKRTYDTHQLVGDSVHWSLVCYFLRMVNLLRDDLVLSKDPALERLATDAGLEPLIPYFLQFIFAQIMGRLREVPVLGTMADVTSAMLRNPCLRSPIYAHAFLKIGFSLLIGADYGSIVQDDDTTMRDQAARLLALMCETFQDAFPSIWHAVFNRLVACLFSPNTSLAAHYGALVGIQALGPAYSSKILPHLPSYFRMIRAEAKYGCDRQVFCVNTLKFALRRMAEGVLMTQESEVAKRLYRLVK